MKKLEYIYSELSTPTLFFACAILLILTILLIVSIRIYDKRSVRVKKKGKEKEKTPEDLQSDFIDFIQLFLIQKEFLETSVDIIVEFLEKNFDEISGTYTEKRELVFYLPSGIKRKEVLVKAAETYIL